MQMKALTYRERIPFRRMVPHVAPALQLLWFWLPAFAVAMPGADRQEPVGNVVWVPCEMGLAAASLQCSSGGVPAVQCANVTVPLNYSAPDGESIALHALRIRSSAGTSERRRGAVWVNAGGPGMSQQPDVYGVLYKFLGCVFDMYFVDYRGTGKSANLGSAGCITADGIDAVGCAKTSAALGDRLHHFSVTNIARDFDYLIPMIQQTEAADAEADAGVGATVIFAYSWGTYVANRLLQVMAARTDGRAYITGVVMDAVCTPGLCKATNIGVNQDRAGRMLLARYCAADRTCAERLRFDPEGFAVSVFDKLDLGKLPCAAALNLQRTELQTLLNALVSGHWPTMRLPMAPAFLYRLDRCDDKDLAALNRSLSAARRQSAAGVPMPVGGSILQELNVEYSDMWRASLGGSGGEPLIPSQTTLDAAYANFLFASNDAQYSGFNGKTVRGPVNQCDFFFLGNRESAREH